MPQRSSSPPRAHTAWHPIFVRLLRELLPPEDFEVHAELLLHEQPQRIDTVVVRRTHPGPEPRSPSLRALLCRFGTHNILELKGPSSPLDAFDFTWLLGYAYQYVGKAGLRAPEELRLFVIANRLSGPFRAMAERYGAAFRVEDPGVLSVSGLPFHLSIFETEAVEDRVLQVFSQVLLRRPDALVAALSAEERALVRSIHREIRQLRRDSAAPLRYVDYQELIMSLDEFIEEIVQDLPAERLLRRIPPEERLRSLSPEDLRALGSDELVRALQGLTPEQREQLRRLL